MTLGLITYLAKKDEKNISQEINGMVFVGDKNNMLVRSCAHYFEKIGKAVFAQYVQAG
jgi:hypothetical protein